MSTRARRAEYPEIMFRSILEARWSVVWDTLCLPWRHEPTTFELPSGLYMPDFQIFPEPGDERQFWVEIKGPWPNAREFQVASEVNLYVAPLMILTGDIPRQANGGTAWWFGDDRQWHMVRPEEALVRTVYRNTQRPRNMGQLWEPALHDARHEELIKMEAGHG